MVKFRIFLILFSLLFFFPVLFFIRDTLPWIESPHVQMVRNEKTQEVVLDSQNLLGQSFTASSDNLGQIALLFHRGKNPSDRYIFHLKHSPLDATDLRSGSFEVRKIQEKAFFQFEPIPDSQGKSFYFYLEPIESASPIGLFTAANDLEGGSLHVNHSTQQQDLIFQVYYSSEMSVFDFTKTLFARMSQFKPAFFKVPFLYVFWLAFVFSFPVLIYFLLQQFVFNTSEGSVIKTRMIFLSVFLLLTLLTYLWIQTQIPRFFLESA